MGRTMKWYNFVIYVQLFLSAIVCAVNGVNYCSGSHYGSEAAKYVYAYYGNGLRMLDLLMGVSSLALAVLAIVVRQKLKNFKADGPKWYINLLALSIIQVVLYIILVYMITSVMALDSTLTANLVVSVVMLFANKKYFDNRMDLFVN